MIKEKSIRFINTLFDFKRAKTRLQLAYLIAAHVIGWLVFFCLPLLFFRIRFTDSDFIYRELVNKLFLIAFFYFNYSFLIPRFFFKKKRVAYFSIVLITVVFLIVQHLLVEKYFFDHLHNTNPSFRFESSRMRSSRWALDSNNAYAGRYFRPFGMEQQPKIFGIPDRPFFMTIQNVVSSAFLLILIGGFIHLAFSFIKNQNEKRALENANLHAEIALLKSQINPHFLFNTLNSIYAQAYHKSENTEHSILKLSEILRYMIYDTTSERIPLEKDVHYISSYIDLQRLRISNKIVINYKVEGCLDDLFIAPLLLITFIENAFKHGISYAQSSIINIVISAFHKTLTLEVSNPVVSSSKFEHSGVGLKNAKRRLELLYPDNYQLDIVENRNLYVVNLKINLNRDQLPDNR